jgi:CheY-like chemotaxis protein
MRNPRICRGTSHAYEQMNEDTCGNRDTSVKSFNPPRVWMKGDDEKMARILVVDDDSVIRELLETVLEEESDHQVIVAANGQEALHQLETAPVDAVVCDVNMPVMDGYELVRALRSNPDLRDMPVLMISAAERLNSVDPDLGVDLMLEKPFELSSLLACVGFILNGVRAGTRGVRVTRRRAVESLDRVVRSGQRSRQGFGASSAG